MMLNKSWSWRKVKSGAVYQSILDRSFIEKLSSVMRMGVSFLSPNCYENECMWTTQKVGVSRIHLAPSQLVQLCLHLL